MKSDKWLNIPFEPGRDYRGVCLRLLCWIMPTLWLWPDSPARWLYALLVAGPLVWLALDGLHGLRRWQRHSRSSLVGLACFGLRFGLVKLALVAEPWIAPVFGLALNELQTSWLGRLLA